MGNLEINVQEALDIIDGGASFMHDGKIVSTRDELRKILGQPLPGDPEPGEVEVEEDAVEGEDKLVIEGRFDELEARLRTVEEAITSLLASNDELEHRVKQLLESLGEEPTPNNADETDNKAGAGSESDQKPTPDEKPKEKLKDK